MFHVPAVVVDIETNGGNGARGRIIEVAALKVIDGEIVDTFTSFINPGTPIPRWITNLTGITDHDVVSAPYFADIAHQLFTFMDGCLFVAHNVRFDYSFLERELKMAGYEFRPPLFCSVRLSRALYPSAPGHSLEKIIARHKLVTKARHRAYDDARAVYEFMRIALNEHGSDAFASQVRHQLRTKTLPPHVDESVILSLPQGPGVYIFEDDTGMPLYVGKSVNIRQRVRSHFVSATTIAREMRLSLQSHNISFIQTDNELEALLLESAKVKELSPVFNRKLRRKTTQSILVASTDDRGYLTIGVETADLADYQGLERVYGTYTSRRQAVGALESAARTYQLCPKLLGLEKTKPGNPCFRYQLGLCRGACIGAEPPESYNPRVRFALERTKIESWPFQSAIALKLSDTRAIIVDQWVVTEIVETSGDEPQRLAVEGGFDLDTYKIIRSFIRRNPHLVASADAWYEEF
jgi:DNA polymerase-3 subunit epsilon